MDGEIIAYFVQSAIESPVSFRPLAFWLAEIILFSEGTK